jgi:sn-glycerol 3-phosphate transport system substrate-binding protein
VRTSRRDLIAGGLAALATPFAGGCRRREVTREDGRVVVSFWYAYGDAVRKVLLDLVGQFNAAQSRVLVKAVHQGDYFECLAKLRTAVAAGAAPALSHVVLEVLPYLARAGVLEPLDGYEGASAIDFVPALAQSGAFAGAGAGALYGIPFNRSTPIAFCNGDLFARAGVRAPGTWEELVETARRLTVRGAETTWGFEVPVSWWYWVALVGQAGGRVVEADGRVSLGGAAGEEALRFWQRLVQDERVMRPPPGRDYQAWQSTNESFLRGQVAMMWTSTA